MILLYKNGEYHRNVLSETFPDGTPLLSSTARDLTNADEVAVLWKYENDAEMFRLMCLVRDLQNKGVSNIVLRLPYIPNARMDRVHSDKDVFTLKYFAEFINSLNFSKVLVLDAHSDVSLGLTDRCYNISSADIIKDILIALDFDAIKGDLIVYPDAGCKKRLEDKIPFPSVFCNKRRDWESGKILGTNVYGYTEVGKTLDGKMLTTLDGVRVLFVDDICSYGGTAKYTLEELKKYGVKECYCYFTHVEKSIFGKAHWQETNDGVPTLLKSGLVNRVFCTDSIISEEYVETADKLGVDFTVIPTFKYI